jgi:Fe-S-cluster containining protein
MVIKQFIPEEFCLKCPGCCRFSQQESIWSPHLLEEEKQKLGEILILANPEEDNFTCCYLKLSNNKCKIYKERPFECQLYPFLFDRKLNKCFLALDLNCAYVSQNKSQPGFQQYTRSLIELVQTPEFMGILKDNPQLFQDYDEVLDLVELKV